MISMQVHVRVHVSQWTMVIIMKVTYMQIQEGKMHVSIYGKVHLIDLNLNASCLIF